MTRIIAVLCGGVLLGVFSTLAVVRFEHLSDPSPGDIVRDIGDVPKMTPAVAEKHRDDQYVNLETIEQVLTLPTAFARSEAMHVLAGRSDSGAVQYLIFETNRIADRVERVDLLSVLFFRLSEADPRSALAIAQTDQFESEKTIEQTVWRSWAHNDFEGALFAAKTQATAVQQKFAAQSLFAAFGYMGNSSTDRIELELGISPDRSSRSRYLYQLADRSAADAIAFINGLDPGVDRQEYLSWLAHYFSSQDANAALQYADLFEVASDGAYFKSMINTSIARDDPRQAIERMLANAGDAHLRNEYRTAVSALARTDLNTAMQYFEQARSAEDRQVLGSAIAAELAKKDPVAALSWARANDTERMPYLEMSVLAKIVAIDPDLALTEALKSSNRQMRSMLVSNVLMHVARENPEGAIAYLDQITDRQQRLEASQHLASAWIQSDADAAIDWILSQDKETTGQLIRQVSYMLLSSDIDAAIRLLPRLDSQIQVSMRQRIAQRLAANKSLGEAQTFIQQFQGQPGYDQLQTSLISGLAQTDVFMAKQLADQLTDDAARDTAYVQIISQRAQTDPIEAARWLGNVSNDLSRGAAAGQLAQQWYKSDPAAATRWVSNLPAGSTRDDAITHMSSSWGELTKEKESLIASIEDRDKRSQAKIRQVYQVMRTNPTKARDMLADDDISDQQRQQIETMMIRYSSRF